MIGLFVGAAASTVALVVLATKPVSCAKAFVQASVVDSAQTIGIASSQAVFSAAVASAARALARSNSCCFAMTSHLRLIFSTGPAAFSYMPCDVINFPWACDFQTRMDEASSFAVTYADFAALISSESSYSCSVNSSIVLHGTTTAATVPVGVLATGPTSAVSISTR